MTAYYNEMDRFKAAWLRELMTAGVIARVGRLRGLRRCNRCPGRAEAFILAYLEVSQ